MHHVSLQDVELQAFVEEVMELVELTPLRLALVGLPGVSGLSTEQRKRLTVAVELVANPSIIFMDEPTSGLDARAAAIVMRTVRNTVDTGRTVVCTIHQPSIDIFEAFDELLLMQRGGRVLYAGPLGHHSQKLIDYFEAVEGVPKIKDGINPSTWMLEVTSQASEQKLDVNFADIYTKSALYQRNEDLINQLSSPAPGVQDISFPTEYAQPFWQQCLACLWKQQRSYWRNPYYNVIRIFLAVLYGCFYGTICLGFGHHRSTEQDVFNMMGALYASTLFLGASNALAVQPVVSVERTVFYRERAAGMYSTFPYSFAQVTVEFPYVFAQAVLFGTILYALIQFEWMAAKFLLFIFFLYFTLLIFTLWGMLTVALTPNPQVAAIVSAAAFGIWNLFAGFLIPRPSLPIYWVWYYWLSPTAWTLYGLVASQLGDVTSLITVKGTYGTHVQATNETRLPIREFLDTHFGFHHSFLPYVAIWHVGIVLVFGLVFAISIKWINFQRR
jgi:energy-coupling factor transporter ATP-binding protein EcfA2/ABC-type multidrug transport system permease subunit